jgi:hypothetical protein
MYESANNNSRFQKLNAAIKKEWPKVDDKIIAALESNLEAFYKEVETKQGVKRDEAEKTVKRLKAECDEACNSESGKDAAAKSAPAPKVANA